MNYYAHHIGDFNNATRHLSRVERSIYRDLMDLYYTREAPVPTDVERVCKLILANSIEEAAAVQIVLAEFFVLQHDGWHNGRCDKELAAYKRMSEGGRTGAANRWRKDSDSPAIATPSIPQEPPQDAPNANHNHNHNHNHNQNHNQNQGESKTYIPNFEYLWRHYPKRPYDNKQKAFIAYKARIASGADANEIFEGVCRYANFVIATSTEPQFIKQAATFLNADEHYKLDWHASSNAIAKQNIHDERRETLDALTGRKDAHEQLKVIDAETSRIA